ncbi:MAG: hypothetical protein RIC53_08340 [Cyclobacteriaceae bacterium]
MQIKIETLVNADLTSVKKGFNQDLFLALNPPFPKVKVLQFDGCRKGDTVSLKLDFLVFSQVWASHIIEEEFTDQSWYFVDRGVTLPFFLKSWKHKHLVKKKGIQSLVIDNINYTTGTVLTDLLMLPVLYLQFLYRKPIYRKHFRF